MRPLHSLPFRCRVVIPGPNERFDECCGGGSGDPLHGGVDHVVAAPEALPGYDGGGVRQAQGEVEHPRRRELLGSSSVLCLGCFLLRSLFAWFSLGAAEEAKGRREREKASSGTLEVGGSERVRDVLLCVCVLLLAPFAYALRVLVFVAAGPRGRGGFEIH